MEQARRVTRAEPTSLNSKTQCVLLAPSHAAPVRRRVALRGGSKQQAGSGTSSPMRHRRNRPPGLPPPGGFARPAMLVRMEPTPASAAIRVLCGARPGAFTDLHSAALRATCSMPRSRCDAARPRRRHGASVPSTHYARSGPLPSADEP